MITHFKQMTFLVLIGFMPLNSWANSYVHNDTKYDVSVYWIAAGCAGLKLGDDCGAPDATFLSGKALVCQKKMLAPGESDGYTFKAGTSNRKVRAAACDANGVQVIAADADNTANKGDKSRCNVKVQSNHVVVKCNYSQSQFDSIKQAD
jgi:hypothetical protein